MKSELIREKAYKRLVYEYKNLAMEMIRRSQNLLDYAKTGDDALKLVSSIADRGTWDYHGIQRKEDSRIVELLEYLLDDNQPVK